MNIGRDQAAPGRVALVLRRRAVRQVGQYNPARLDPAPPSPTMFVAQAAETSAGQPTTSAAECVPV